MSGKDVGINPKKKAKTFFQVWCKQKMRRGKKYRVGSTLLISPQVESSWGKEKIKFDVMTDLSLKINW